VIALGQVRLRAFAYFIIIFRIIDHHVVALKVQQQILSLQD
jgi:hypothetical protein